MACAGSGGPPPSTAPPTWRPATGDDLAVGLAEALGEVPELAVMIDLYGTGQLVLVRIEVDDAGGARVAVVDGPVLGALPPAPPDSGPVTSGLWGWEAGRLPVRERMSADLVMFAAEHAVVEWCLPPDGVPWTAGRHCYGSAILGLQGDTLRRFEVWD